MRFILNFIFFGIIFFLIWHYMPETFQTLVSWMNKAFLFVQDLITWGIQKAGIGAGSTPPPASP